MRTMWYQVAPLATLASTAIAASLSRGAVVMERDPVAGFLTMERRSPRIMARQEGCTYTDFVDAPITQTSTFYDPSNAAPTLTRTYTSTVSGSPGCQCADGSTTGLYEEVGDDGQTTTYCATGTPFSTGAVATSTATASPGDPNNEAWAQISCDTDSLQDATNNPWQQYNDSGASAAYDAAMEHCKNDDRPFSECLGQFFHTRPFLSCQILDNPNCQTSINCGQGISEPNAPVSAPAGYILVNSMINFHVILEDIYNGVNDALPFVEADAGNFVGNFSPIVQDIEEQRDLKLALDALQLGLIFAAAPTLHVALTRTAFVKANPNAFGTGVDVTYGVIGTSMGFAKDAMKTLSTLPVQNAISSQIKEVAGQWLSALGNTTADIFDDPEGLFGIIDQGKLFTDNVQSDPNEMRDRIEKLLFATTLQAVWKSGSDIIFPVILRNTDVPQDGTGCDSFDLTTYDDDSLDGHLDFGTDIDDISSSTRICDGDSPFWLVGMKPEYWEGYCSTGPAPTQQEQCDGYTAHMSILTGWDKLDGSFAGLTKEGVAWNAINSWTDSDFVNGVDFATTLDNLADSDVIDEYISDDLSKSKGIVSIPVNSVEEMIGTMVDDVDNTKGNANYPCPA